MNQQLPVTLCRLVFKGGEMFNFKKRTNEFKLANKILVQNGINTKIAETVLELLKPNEFIVVDDKFISSTPSGNAHKIIPKRHYPISDTVSDLLSFIINPLATGQNYIIIVFSANRSRFKTYIISRDLGRIRK